MKKEVYLKLEGLAKETAEEKGLELVELNQKKTQDGLHIEAIIFSKEGVGIDTCVDFSRAFDKKLEDIDLGPSPYFIEVASPGLDRPIKSDDDLRGDKGVKVEVRLYQKQDGEKEFLGDLLDYTKEEVTLQTPEGQQVTIPRDKISLMRQSIEF